MKSVLKYNNYTRRISAFLTLLLIASVSILGQQNDQIRLDTLKSNLFTQLNLSHQEKIHLQLDKSIFIPGEKIWFRSFLVDAVFHQPNTESRYIYVELINPEGSIVNRVLIKPDDDNLHYGYLSIPEDIASGTYNIRAYTTHMRNVDESYFFRKSIQILDPKPVEYNSEAISDAGEYNVSFHPEGGYIPEGTPSLIAFKAIKANGLHEDISGYIIDDKNDTIMAIQSSHMGMGVFSLNAMHGKRYRAVCKNKEGIVKHFGLPSAMPDAYVLHVNHSRGRLWVSVLASQNIVGRSDSLYLLIHTRGSIQYVDKWNFDKKIMAFDSSQFPSGISQIVLLNSHMQPISERLIFHLNDDQAYISFQPDKPDYKTREQVKLKMKVTDSDKRLLDGSFSVAVTDDDDIQPDTTTTILSNLLLTSELRGHVENPAFYLQAGDVQASNAADLLMMTQGWRRYNIDQALRGDFQYPTVPAEVGQEISGIVKDGYFKKEPLKDSHVSLLSLNYDYMDFTKTDNSGCFSFNGFEFPDSTRFLIQARTKKGRDSRVELYVNKYVSPSISYIAPFTKMNQDNKELVFNFLEKANQKYTLENGIRMIHLDAVEVKGRIKEKATPPTSFYAHLMDNVYTSKDIANKNYVSIESLLRIIRGVKIEYDMYQKPMIFIRKSPVLFIINDLYIDDFDIRDIDINDIETIGIIRGHKGAILGSRGKNAIVITTKKMNGEIPKENKMNIKQITPLGYQNPVEFYSPKYETKEQLDSPNPDLRSVLFWKPNVILSENGEAVVDFYTADTKTSYTIITEGITSSGKIFHGTQKIYVK